MAPQVTLFTNVVPNPLKVAILLEELGVEYVVEKKEMGAGPNGVKGPDYLKINPNGRLPALIDHTNNEHIVWESGAILLYVAERFDTRQKFVGKTLEERSEVWQWLFFQVSGLGPMQGQIGWFLRYHPVKDLDPSVMERYKNETYRVFSVLENRLEQQGDWIALNQLTVVDMANYPWVNGAEHVELSLDRFPKLQAYRKRMQELPSVQRAFAKINPTVL